MPRSGAISLQRTPGGRAWAAAEAASVHSTTSPNVMWAIDRSIARNAQGSRAVVSTQHRVT